MLAALSRIEARESLARIMEQNATEELIRELVFKETGDARTADKVYGELLIRKWAAQNEHSE